MKIKIKGLTPLAEIVKTIPPMPGDMVIVNTTGLNEDNSENPVILIYFVTAKHYVIIPTQEKAILIAEYNDTCDSGEPGYVTLQFCAAFEDNSSTLINYEQ